MAIEKHWSQQGPVSFTADGGVDGLITVSSVVCFKVKQKVKIFALGEPDLPLQVKRVISLTQLIVGPLKKKPPGSTINNLKQRSDLSAYTVAKSSGIVAVEQPKVTIPEKDIIQAVYEHEPTTAIRSFLVDKVGDGYTATNPLPTTTTIVPPVCPKTMIKVTCPAPGWGCKPIFLPTSTDYTYLVDQYLCKITLEAC